MFEWSLPSNLAWIFVVVLIASGCSDDGLSRYDDSFCRKKISEPSSVDASDWLRTPSSEPNHFGAMSATESLAFVDRLESSGAERMVVVSTGLGTEHGRGLVVRLPSDSRRRLALFQLYAKQVRNLGHEPLADTGQTFLFLPWRY